MFLNAIRFKALGDEQNRVWRFTPGNPVFKNIVCIQESQHTLKQIKQALAFAISGERNSSITEVAAQITDDAGDVWIMERTGERTRILKNGKAMESLAMADALFQSALDLDRSSDSNDKVVSMVNYIVEMDEQVLTAKLEEQVQSPLMRVRTSIKREISGLAKKAAALFEQPLIEDADVIHKIKSKAETLFSSYRETLRQRRSLLANFQSLETFDDRLVEQLEREIDIIKDIEKIAAPMLDPANSPKILKEKLTKLEDELKDSLAGLSMDESRLPLIDLPWEKLISCLSKLEASERLIQASEKAQQLCSDRVEHIQSEYLRTLEQLLSTDNQITAELESCLSTLSLQLAVRKQEKTTLTDMVVKFIKPTANVPVEEPENEKMARLETARLAVDFALTRLGELHANLGEARTSFDQLSFNLKEHHETLVHEHGKLKALWQRLAREHRLSPQMHLSELLKICVQYVQLNEVFIAKNQYREILANRKNQTRKLEELIVDWRRTSESQKDTPLSNASILFSEAQSIIRYLSAKEQQLAKLKDLREQVRAYNALNANLTGRETQIKAAWKKVFQELDIPEMAPDRTGWPEFFEIANQIVAWKLILTSEKRSFAREEIFSAESSDMPITTYVLQGDQTLNMLQLQLIQALSNATLKQSLVMIMTSDKSIADLLAKQGTGSARFLPPTAAPAPKTQTTVDDRRHNKLQEVINLLAPKKFHDLEK